MHACTCKGYGYIQTRWGIQPKALTKKELRKIQDFKSEWEAKLTPEAFDVLGRLFLGREVTDKLKLVAKLENMGLARNGELTALGLRVYLHLREPLTNHS